jgi:hypothetical protein
MENKSLEKQSRLEFTAKFIEGVKANEKETRYTDAKTPGLTLAVKPPTSRKRDGAKLWRFRYMLGGKAKMLSLGEYPVVSLKDARDKAFELRKTLDSGTDPSQERKLGKQFAGKTSFRAISEAWLDDRTENKWEASHAKRNRERLTNNLFPVFGDKDVNALTLLFCLINNIK